MKPPSYRGAATIVAMPVGGRDGREDRMEAEFGHSRPYALAPLDDRVGREGDDHEGRLG